MMKFCKDCKHAGQDIHGDVTDFSEFCHPSSVYRSVNMVTGAVVTHNRHCMTMRTWMTPADSASDNEGNYIFDSLRI